MIMIINLHLRIDVIIIIIMFSELLSLLLNANYEHGIPTAARDVARHSTQASSVGFGKTPESSSSSSSREEVLELGCGNGNFKALTFWPRRVIKR